MRRGGAPVLLPTDSSMQRSPSAIGIFAKANSRSRAVCLPATWIPSGTRSAGAGNRCIVGLQLSGFSRRLVQGSLQANSRAFCVVPVSCPQLLFRRLFRLSARVGTIEYWGEKTETKPGQQNTTSVRGASEGKCHRCTKCHRR